LRVYKKEQFVICKQESKTQQNDLQEFRDRMRLCRILEWD